MTIDLLRNKCCILESMFTIEKLRRKPQHFHAFTGLTPDEFDTILNAVQPHYDACQEQRLNHPGRQRQSGAGHPFNLPLAARLLMTLMYWRVYLTQGLLGFLFELDDSNVSREIRRMRRVLLVVLPVPMRDSNLITGQHTPTQTRLASLNALLEQHPEFNELFLDATEQPIFRPQDQLARSQRYSGKQHAHTIKTQVLSTARVITHVLGQMPGRVHDHLLLQGSGVLSRIPTDRVVRLDRAYEGVESLYPELQFEKAIRKPRAHALTILGKVYNQMQSRLRMPVEHMIGRLKRFNILAFQYRGGWTNHEDTVMVIAGLVNFVALGSLSWSGVG